MEAKGLCFNCSASRVMSLAQQKRKAADTEDGRKVVVSAAAPWVDVAAKSWAGPQVPEGIWLPDPGTQTAHG